MKIRLPLGVCVLIALALVAFGLLYGTYGGYLDDRAQVMELENSVQDVLAYRGADGLNLCVVARRHLSAADADVLALESTARRLQDEQLSLPQKAEANAQMDAAVAAVSTKLRQTPSFQASDRDQKYLDMISADLNSLSSSAAASPYHQAAAAFNAQLDAPLVGALARMLGIDPCPLYQ